ncbi:hypothetical protein [Haloflavibacter putidus]|uniref:Uncharacterized protein n=1 Tax=Haloflavibacter putidus TaxID=2576776 RepID=A0A507ZIY7_9FLAO|nr:hypothetical protein [Haloflavibacter putidus]TQD37676.1 hypothetical protein FKR84_09390 [Haloflavibacter putidus]
MQRNLFLAFFSAFFLLNLSAQAQNKKEILREFNQVFGVRNLKINNGPLHTNTFRTINDKIRYYSKDYLSSSLYYDGSIYYNVPLKFDEFEQQLVLKLQNSTTDFGVNLANTKIDSFAFGTSKFINIKKTEPEFAKSKNIVFAEKIALNNNLTLYVHHAKGKRDRIKGSSVYYEFTKQKSYFVEKGQAFYTINSRSDFYPIFPSKKKTIKEYYRIYKSLRKSNEYRFISNLLQYLSE